METRQTEPARRQDLDIIKGLAIMAVVLIHVTGHFLSRIATYEIPWLVLATVNRALQFAVPAFLMVSAFLYTTKLQRSANTTAVAWNKASAIITPYLLWSAIGIVLNYGDQWSELGGRHLVKILLWGRAMYHLYFLILLLQMIALLPCIIAWFPKQVRLVPMLVGIAFLQAMFYLINRNFWQFEYIGTCVFWYLPSIGLGIWLAQNEQRIGDLRRMYFIPIILVTALIFGVYYPLALSVLQQESVNTALSQASEWVYTTGACLLLFCMSQSTGSRRALHMPSKLGTHSFAIYIAHPIVIFVLDRVLANVTGLHSGPIIALYVLGCLGIPLLPTFAAPLFFRIKYYIRSFNWHTAMAWRRALLGLFIGLTFLAASSPSQGASQKAWETNPALWSPSAPIMGNQSQQLNTERIERQPGANANDLSWIVSSPLDKGTHIELNDSMITIWPVHPMAQIVNKSRTKPQKLAPQDQQADPIRDLIVMIDAILVIIVLGSPRPTLKKLRFKNAQPKAV